MITKNHPPKNLENKTRIFKTIRTEKQKTPTKVEVSWSDFCLATGITDTILARMRVKSQQLMRLQEKKLKESINDHKESPT